jgi:hypothetical protein
MGILIFHLHGFRHFWTLYPFLLTLSGISHHYLLICHIFVNCLLYGRPYPLPAFMVSFLFLSPVRYIFSLYHPFLYLHEFLSHDNRYGGGYVGNVPANTRLKIPAINLEDGPQVFIFIFIFESFYYLINYVSLQGHRELLMV